MIRHDHAEVRCSGFRVSGLHPERRTPKFWPVAGVGWFCTLFIALLAFAEAGAECVELPYASSDWPTSHRDSSNSDFFPSDPPVRFEHAWSALKGSAILTAATLGPGGRVYVTTGKSGGAGNLHAFDRNGRRLWSKREVDSGAVLGAPIVDRDGDVYVGDQDQLWAFYPSGIRKWVAPIPAPLGTAVFGRGDTVGGVTINGDVLFFDRNTGARVTSAFQLSGPGPVGPDAPPGLWRGLMDPRIRTTAYARLRGGDLSVANIPAVHPCTGRIYFAIGVGIFYGIDIYIEDDLFSVGFSVGIGKGSATSPALSADGSTVYVANGEGGLFAIDAFDGTVLWTRYIGDTFASPAVAPDGRLYVTNANRVLALSAEGDLLWERDLSILAPFFVPPLGGAGRVLRPAARVVSVISATPSHLYLQVDFGYPLAVLGGATLVFPRWSGLVILDRFTGFLAAFPVQLPDTGGAVVSLGSDGRVYAPHGATLSSVAYHALNPLLPGSLKFDPPVGGFTVLRPAVAR